MSNKYIYAFLHIPKTAGTTFRYHIEKYLKDKERLYLGADVLGLWYPNKDPHPDDLRKAVDKKLNELTNEEKRKIRIIYGHGVTYGLDKYFERPVRYFTFFRDPVKRTVSQYNHLKDQYLEFKRNGKDLRDLEINFLVNGNVPDFEKWLDKKYNHTGSNKFLAIYRRLWLNGFIKDRDDFDIDKLLKKFWFVGMVENFDNESLYLYNKIGINAFFTNRNISKKHFSLNDDERIRKKIVDRNKEDLEIYKKALVYNKKILKEVKDFDILVNKMKMKRRYLLPFTQTYYAPLDTLRLIFQKLL